jgi:hypothetical protein
MPKSKQLPPVTPTYCKTPPTSNRTVWAFSEENNQTVQEGQFLTLLNRTGQTLLSNGKPFSVNDLFSRIKIFGISWELTESWFESEFVPQMVKAKRLKPIQSLEEQLFEPI